MSDTNTRSIVKTVTWRITGSGSTFLIVYLTTGQLFLSSGIAMTQLFANSILYWFHERIWNRIKWGRLD
jgi:uncharacterized membrane protein